MAMLALLSLAFCAGLLGSTDGFVRSSEGTPVPIELFPSLVQIDFRGITSGIWGQACAGSILNSIHILTAANCFHGVMYLPANRRIRAGSANRDTGGSIAYVLHENNHPTYGRIGNDGDISVVRLVSPLVFGNTIRQAIIIGQGSYLFGGLPMVHAGWGATTQGGTASSILLRNNLFTIDLQFCRERYEGLSIPEPVTDNMLCVGFLGPAVEESVCLGDFGGPVYYPDSLFGNLVSGITSWGYGCSNSTFPGVTTAVSSYTDWIISIAHN